MAQQGDETAPSGPQAPTEDAAPVVPEQQDALPETGTGPVDDREAALRGHLDGLFARLANPQSPDWQQVQAQIRVAWNQSGSPSMDLLATRADKAMEEERHDDALLFLNDLTRLAPDFAEGWNKRATVYFLQGSYGDSIDDIARTLALEPRHFGALSGLGIILDRLGDKKGALEAYRRAVEIHPNLPGAQEGIKKLTKEVEGQRL
ncbi:MAG: tetratricopeptide repeat protein [Pseudomonadota bacterium]